MALVLPYKPRNTHLVIGVLYILTATLGLLGLWWYRPAVDWAYLLMLLGFFPIAAAFTLIPHRFLEDS